MLKCIRFEFRILAVSLGLAVSSSACQTHRAGTGPADGSASDRRPAADSAPEPSDGVERCEIVVIEASLGGVAAALHALKMGAKVCMTSMTDWVGGQMTTQAVSAIDEPFHLEAQARKFLAQKELERRRSEPVDTDAAPDAAGAATDTRSAVVGRPATAEVKRTMAPWLKKIRGKGKCWVSSHCFAPSEGDRVLKEELAPYVRSGQLRMFYEAVPKRVFMSGSRIAQVEVLQRAYTGEGEAPYALPLSSEFLDWYERAPSRRYQKRAFRLAAPIFVDATETGEILVLSGAKYRLGFEGGGRQRPEAECLMGFVFPVNLAARKPREGDLDFYRSIALPVTGERFDISRDGQFKFWKDDPTPTSRNLSVFNYRRYQGSPGATLMNWGPRGNDYSEENLIMPPQEARSQLADWKGGVRVGALRKAEGRSAAFVLWLNQQPQVQWKGRGVSPILSSDPARDAFGTGTGMSKFPYIRETRRMEGYQGYYVKDVDVLPPPPPGAGADFDPTAPRFTDFGDSVGIGSYPVDLRECPTGHKWAWPKYPVSHYQVPLRALVSANVPNLLAANKTLAVSQIANASFRVQPTEWNAGFGAGAAAAVAVKHGVDAHGLMDDPEKIREIQRAVVSSGGRVKWYTDEIPEIR